MVRYKVTLGEVLEYLSSTTQAKSPIGCALDRAESGAANSNGDPKRVQAKVEESTLREAAVIRCVDKLEVYASVRFVAADDLRRFAKAVRIGDGAAAVGVLRRYQPWATSWPEKGLVEVYGWMRERRPTLPALKAEGESSAAQAFRSGKSKKARAAAIRILADAEVVIGEWVERWNRKADEGKTAGSLDAA